MHPELERTVTVSSQGNITFPPIGELKASGLTAKQLADKVTERLSTYLRQTTSVTVQVTQYLSHSVFVSGAVARPGRYGFERIPTLLDVISAAGGALPNADLSRVQVLHREGTTLHTVTADLTTAMQRGTSEGLPQLAANDVVVVPASATAGGPLTLDAVGVMGEVNRPGFYPVGDGLDLWMVLALAGGPTNRGNLGAIKVLTRDQKSQSSAVSVNLGETLSRGYQSPYVVKPGDVVYLNTKGTAWNVFLSFLGITRDVLGVVLLADAVKNNKK
jgi:polysaccharide export outer membrane protein